MNNKKKNKNRIKIDFIGEERNDVTGSAVLIEYPKGNDEFGLILCDLGLVQGESTFDKDISKNRKMLDRLPKDIVSRIEYVLISHAHVDHLGNLSYLNKENGFHGKILGSKQTLEIGKELIEDTVNIHIKNIEKLKSLGKKTRPLYNKQQMLEMFDYMKPIETYKKIKLNEQIEIEFVNAGHCVGSTMINIWIKRPNNSIFHIIYSGDMGGSKNRLIHPLALDREKISKCNLLISEATYNNKNKSFTKQDTLKEFEDFKNVIKENLLQGKQILLNVFAFNKVQEFIILLYEWLKDEEWFNYDIIPDGVLMHKISHVFQKELSKEQKYRFEKALNWDKIKPNKTFDGTMALLSKKEPRIIMASSGFMQQGKIVTYLKQFLGSSNSVIISTGYYGGEGSIGWKILKSPQKTVSIEKQVILKRALTKSYNCFSSHIQYDELLSLFKGIRCDKILIHHSSNEDKLQFVKEAREYSNKNIECVTDKNYEFIF